MADGPNLNGLLGCLLKDLYGKNCCKHPSDQLSYEDFIQDIIDKYKLHVRPYATKDELEMVHAWIDRQISSLRDFPAILDRWKPIILEHLNLRK